MGKEIGIDLGTTNTVVSYINNYNEPVTMELLNTDETVIPSLVFYEDKSKFKIGRAAQNMQYIYPEAFIKNFKSSLSQKNKKIPITSKSGQSFKITAQKAATDFLIELIKSVQGKIAEEYGEEEDMNYISNAVITIPAKFEDIERNAIKAAAFDAGLQKVELMAEPTAAAIAYVNERPNMEGKTVLVYDFGGGTFDISVLSNKNGVFKTLYTDGVKDLGGNNITNSLVEDMTEKINSYLKNVEKNHFFEVVCNPAKYDPELGIDKKSFLINYMKIYSECNEKLKHRLARNRKKFDGEIPIIVQNNDDGTNKVVYFKYSYTLEELEDLIRSNITTTIEITKKALLKTVSSEPSNLKNVKIDCIILAGGSSKLPLVKKMLQELIIPEYEIKFNSMPIIYQDDDVSTLISRGAAIMANRHFPKPEVEEISNVEYGVASPIGNLVDGFKVIIEDDQKIPCEGVASFEISDNISDEFCIRIYSRNAKAWDKINATITSPAVNYIDKLIINNIPDGKNRILMTKFTLKKDGTLFIEADIMANGKVISKNHEIKKGSNLL